MRFPEYPESFPQPAISPIDVFIENIGATSRNSLKQAVNIRPGKIRRASLLIGHACFLADTNSELSQGIAQQVQDELEPHIETEPSSGQAYPHYNIAQLVEHRDDPDTINRIRHNMHYDSIHKLAHLANLRSTTEGVGLHAQLRAEAFLSRIRHPWLLSMNSLEHHDKSRLPPSNHDLVVAEALPTTDPSGTTTVPTSFHRIQVKSMCFSQCGNEAEPIVRKGRQKHFLELRARYFPSITLLSGCCDFRSPEDNTHLDKLLLQECHDNVTDEETRLLDSITNHILMITTTPGALTGRGGLYPGGEPRLWARADRFAHHTQR